MEKTIPSKAGKAIMEWSYRDRLIQDIEDTCKRLDYFYNIDPKTKGTYVWINHLEKLLVDMEKIKRQLENNIKN